MHRHKWQIWVYDKKFPKYVGRCNHCDDTMEYAEVERRLNAVECLSKTSALAAHLTTRNSGDWVSAEDLLNYAEELEGEDAQA